MAQILLSETAVNISSVVSRVKFREIDIKNVQKFYSLLYEDREYIYDRSPTQARGTPYKQIVLYVLPDVACYMDRE